MFEEGQRYFDDVSRVNDRVLFSVFFQLLVFLFLLVLQIFCAICRSKEVIPENDIILCDGACDRGFHQFCLDPPLKTEDSKLFIELSELNCLWSMLLGSSVMCIGINKCFHY